jgi:hypothetical protein
MGEFDRDALKHLLRKVNGVPLTISSKDLAREMYHLPNGAHSPPTKAVMMAGWSLAVTFNNPPAGFSVELVSIAPYTLRFERLSHDAQ